MLEINKIYNGDCLEVMKLIDDKSIDMILCDLPYGTTACKWDTIIPFELLWTEYKRIIKDNGAIVLTGSQPFTSALVMSNIKMFKYEIIWDKIKPSNFQMMNFQVGRIHENILIFSKAKAVFSRGNEMAYHPQKTQRNIIKKVNKTFYGSRNSTLREDHTIKDLGYKEYTEKHPVSIYKLSNANNTINKLHPTQKPVALFEYLIKTYTNEGDLVLDNCAGSGTTGIACININRNYIMIEKEEKYFNIIENRIKEHIDKQKQFLI